MEYHNSKVEKADDIEKIYICTVGSGYHYLFKCFHCNTEFELITSAGRYGNLGPFTCPACNTDYYATIDDHEDPCAYVARMGEQPSSLLDSEGKNRCVQMKNDGLGWY